MNRIGIWLLIVGLGVMLAGCGVSKDEFDALKAERDALEDELALVQKENEVVKKEIMDLYREQQEYNSRMEECLQKVRQLEQAQPKESDARKTGTGAGAYEVQAGDTLYAVSVKTGVDMATLRQLNRIQGDFIYVGQRLRLK